MGVLARGKFRLFLSRAGGQIVLQERKPPSRGWSFWNTELDNPHSEGIKGVREFGSCLWGWPASCSVALTPGRWTGLFDSEWFWFLQLVRVTACQSPQDRLEWKPPCQCRGDESPVEDWSLDLQYFMLGEVAQKLSSRRGRKGGYASFVCCFCPEYCLLLLANTVCCPGTWQWGWVKSSALKETYSNKPKKLRREGRFLSLAQMR